MERLQKVIAQGGICSRRKAEQLILEGKVSVNNEIITQMGFKVSSSDLVMVDGVLVERLDHKYLVINKPRYVVSSVNDEHQRKTVISILPEKLQHYHLFPIGRLDYDTKGVLLLTNDGDFMNALVGPKSQIEKEYLVRVEGILTKPVLTKLEQGMAIDDYVTRKCQTYLVSADRKNNSSLAGIILNEGKYHQIKKMFAAVGFPVKRLTRIKFGEITADGLQEGEFRDLTPHEIKRLFVLSQGKTLI
ncbi:MAG: pseudouridine synthase [Bacilli bacterium]